MDTKIWEDLVKRVTMGTNNLSNPLQSLDNQLIQWGLQPAENPEKNTLLAASVWSILSKTSVAPARLPNSEQLPKYAPNPELIPCPKNLSKLLEYSLKHNHEEIFEEFFEVFERKAYTLPDYLLVDLLNYGIRQAQLHPKIGKWIGEKGRWLANYHPDWAYARAELFNFEDLGLFEHGNLTERCDWFKRYRFFEPTAAFELLVKGWNQEDNKSRPRLLEILAADIRTDELDFIKNCASDPNKEVQKIANALLCAHSDSPISLFLAELAQKYAYFDQKNKNWVVADDIPKNLLKTLSDKGVLKQRPAHVEGGELGQAVFGLLAAIPFGYWRKQAGIPTAELLTLAVQSDWKMSVFGGLAAAIQQTGEASDKIALHLSYLNGYQTRFWDNISTGFVGQGLKPEDLQTICEDYTQHAHSNFSDSHPVISLFSHMRHWSPTQASQLLHLWHKCAKQETYLYSYGLRALLQRAAYAVPPTMLESLRESWEKIEAEYPFQWQKEFRTFLNLLEHRRILYEG